jgi:hypothetical protein
MADQIHVDDIGTVLTITVKENGTAVDLSDATAKKLVLDPPNGTILNRDIDFATDGKNGKLKYTTIEGDLPEAGQYKYQVHITTPSGEWHSSIGTFKVIKNLGI